MNIIQNATEYADEQFKKLHFGAAERQMIIEAFIAGYEAAQQMHLIEGKRADSDSESKTVTFGK